MEKAPLEDFVQRHENLFVLTGAGCSTNSGIPDYRDSHGNWKRTQPVNFQAFMSEEHTRRRYWARSLIGWRRFGQARPNDAHHALARLEAGGGRAMLLTPKVDPPHQTPRHPQGVDFHGPLPPLPRMGRGGENPRGEIPGRLRPA